jgi:Mg-chelatase subunit ChlI
MKRALILSLIDPRIAGVIITRDKGTGKSTIVRLVIDLLPQIKVAKGDSSVTDYDLMSNDVKRGTTLSMNLKECQWSIYH